jgi:flagellar biosynthesis/type III secretory pathway protein FliH
MTEDEAAQRSKAARAYRVGYTAGYRDATRAYRAGYEQGYRFGLQDAEDEGTEGSVEPTSASKESAWPCPTASWFLPDTTPEIDLREESV